MYTRGVTCFSCHDVHGTRNNADLVKPAAEVCLTCHGPKSPNGPHTARSSSTRITGRIAGNECVACHMPKIEQTIADVNVRSHTFRFITPTMTESSEDPEPLHGLPQGQDERLGDRGTEAGRSSRRGGSDSDPPVPGSI